MCVEDDGGETEVRREGSRVDWQITTKASDTPWSGNNASGCGIKDRIPRHEAMLRNSAASSAARGHSSQRARP